MTKSASTKSNDTTAQGIPLSLAPWFQEYDLDQLDPATHQSTEVTKRLRWLEIEEIDGDPEEIKAWLDEAFQILRPQKMARYLKPFVITAYVPEPDSHKESSMQVCAKNSSYAHLKTISLAKIAVHDGFIVEESEIEQSY